MMKRVDFLEISIEDLQKVHDSDLIERLLSCEKYAEDEISQIFNDENFENKYTPQCARLAAGSALEGMKDVVSSPYPVYSAFCLIRPPGHHALANVANGY